MSDTFDNAIIEDTAVKLLRFAATQLPSDVSKALKNMHEQEVNPPSKAALKTIVDNFTMAETATPPLPLCQDTGIHIYYVNIGENFPKIKGIEETLRKASARATEEVPLRPNAVNPIVGGNTGDNTGRHIPFINYDFIPGADYLEITAFPKGGGSENMCALGMLKPGQGINGIKKFVIDIIINAGGQPCPPVVVGVGIGGGADIALKLGKKQLLRPLGQRHSDPEIAKLEEDLLKAINMTGIGSMGLGGEVSTALDVKIEFAHRHPASLPAAVAIQCWAARRATARIYPDKRVEFVTHKEV
ncbi:MAG: fumarate hydratase [Candidatus Heimdallarchaeota archaeon]|nr:MAG: fumarate hydratase [Candidatus Heimdallarchaeota archaeon]